MREAKKHWYQRTIVPVGTGFRLTTLPLCGANSIKYANKKRAVTCLTCKRLIAGYQGEVK